MVGLAQWCRRAGRAGLVAGLVLAGLAPGLPAAAATYSVPCGEDGTDPAVALVAAIRAAQSGDVLLLTAGCAYVLTAPADTRNGLPLIDKTLTIRGNGATIARSTASGTPQFRIIEVSWAGNLSMERVTISNGAAPSGSLGGGGILAGGRLSLTEVTLSGNTASLGGAIQAWGGPVEITDSTLTGNTAVYGGAIYTSSTALTVIASTFDGNAAEIIGGAIASTGDSTRVIRSTLANNTVTSDGGGGGAIYTAGFVELEGSTLAGNSSPLGAGAAVLAGSGGLVWWVGSIVAGGPAPNCAAVEPEVLVDNGHNLDSGDSCGFDPSIGSISNTDPRLGPLADNGGPTPTMALDSTSPAVDRIAPNQSPGCPGVDQRGIARPQGAACDIGAFERDPSAADLSVAVTDAPDPVGALGPERLTYTITVHNAGPSAANAVTLVDTLPGTVTFVSANASQGGPCTRSGATVTCPLGDLPAGADATVTIRVDPQSPGTISNTTTVDATEPDPDPTDNTASTTTRVATLCLRIDGIRICAG